VTDSGTSDYLDKINITAHSLNDIITRLTSISQISSQPIKPEEVNVYSMVNDIVDRSKKSIKYNVTFKLSDSTPPSVMIDKVLLEFILSSLVDNAFKYYDPAEKQSYVELDMELNNDLHVQVRDNGSGIDEKFKDRIFDLFFVASERHHGSGIGLYQAMLATDRLRGSIELKRMKKPTVFDVSLPIIDPSNDS